MSSILRIVRCFLGHDAALHTERAGNGGEYGDEKLNDSLPGFKVLHNSYGFGDNKLKFRMLIYYLTVDDLRYIYD